MRLTREALIKIARDTAAQRVKVSRRLVCIYLTGSVLGDDPMLGGTTDIDLIVVHDSEPAREREIVRLTDDVHLDIAHYAQSVYHQPRHLRADPWMGPFIYAKPIVLHDTQHWFEFTQAATGAQFYQPDYCYQRARSLYQQARDTWMQLHMGSTDSHPRQVHTYLQALEDAGNALAVLTGPPLTERRFFIHLGQRAMAVDQPELSARLMNMIMSPEQDVEQHWSQWLDRWNAAYLAAGKQEGVPARLTPTRLPYYQKAAAALWESHPVAALWIMLRTWTQSACYLPDGAPEMDDWTAFQQALHFHPEGFDARIEALDQYLDAVEEALDAWARSNGVSSLLE